MKEKSEQIESVLVEEGRFAKLMKRDGEPVLTIMLRRPVLKGNTAAEQRMERYYAKVAAIWKKRWEGALLERAAASLSRAREASRPFRPWEVSLDYSVTYNREGRLSIRMDARESCGGPATLVCTGDVWDLATGTPILLPVLLHKRNWKKTVFDAVCKQAEAQLAAGSALYEEEWKHIAKARLDPGHCYLTEEGIAVFYPQCILAPRVEGIPVFLCAKGREGLA